MAPWKPNTMDKLERSIMCHTKNPETKNMSLMCLCGCTSAVNVLMFPVHCLPPSSLALTNNSVSILRKNLQFSLPLPSSSLYYVNSVVLQKSWTPGPSRKCCNTALSAKPGQGSTL